MSPVLPTSAHQRGLDYCICLSLMPSLILLPQFSIKRAKSCASNSINCIGLNMPSRLAFEFLQLVPTYNSTKEVSLASLKNPDLIGLVLALDFALPKWVTIFFRHYQQNKGKPIAEYDPKIFDDLETLVLHLVEHRTRPPIKVCLDRLNVLMAIVLPYLFDQRHLLNMDGLIAGTLPDIVKAHNIDVNLITSVVTAAIVRLNDKALAETN